MKIETKDCRVREGETVKLKKWPTRVKPFYRSNDEYRDTLNRHVEKLSDLQELHYASNRHAVLLIFQAMDAAGKDGGIKHVMFGVNPQGCQGFSFKHPSATQLEQVSVSCQLRFNRVFLRSLIAPFYLLAASVLALLSALGLTVWVFQRILGYGSLVYYVPFAVAVLLVSLGSDYNLFVVGRIWEEARRRPVRDAVATAVPRASRAITTAGLALAAGFAVLALVPLDQFREIAVAMVIGITIDTFIVRSLLVPSLVVLSGRAGRKAGWKRARIPPAR